MNCLRSLGWESASAWHFLFWALVMGSDVVGLKKRRGLGATILALTTGVAAELPSAAGKGGR